jgi:hypothetical protein
VSEEIHLVTVAQQVADCVAAIEAALAERARQDPVEFSMVMPPRSASVSVAYVVLERRRGTWGLFLHEVQTPAGMVLEVVVEATVTPLRDTALTVRVQFLDRSEKFVAGALDAMEAARTSAVPALAAGDRALAKLREKQTDG